VAKRLRSGRQADAAAAYDVETGKQWVFDALGLDGTVYLADGVSELAAVEP